MNRAREYEAVLAKELGPIPYRLVRSKRHPVIRVEPPGRAPFSVVLPGSPSDRRGLANFRAQLRRKVRDV